MGRKVFVLVVSEWNTSVINEGVEEYENSVCIFVARMGL